MRRRTILLRLHLALGLMMGAALFLIGVSGAILVFRRELDEALEPSAIHADPGAAQAPLQQLVDTARLRHPQFTPTSLTLPEETGLPARVRMMGASGDELDVLLDPYTGRVLASRWQNRSPLHALRTLHAELYMGSRGSIVVGVLGLGLFLQGSTGLYLWWPFMKRPARGFAIRWPRTWRVLSYDLHKTVGVASLVFNLPVALTGALLGLTALAPLAPREEAMSPRSLAGTGLAPVSLDVIARRADAALPGGRLVSVRLPTTSEAAVIVRKRLTGDLDPRGGSFVVVNRYGGRVLSVSDARNGPLPARLWRLVAPLHFGDFAGIASKLLYFVGGLTSSVLVITGFLIWLTRPRARAGQAHSIPSPPGGREGRVRGRG